MVHACLIAYTSPAWAQSGDHTGTHTGGAYAGLHTGDRVRSDTVPEGNGHPDAGGGTVTRLSEVTVEGYLSGQSLLRTPTSVGIVDLEQLRRHNDASFLPAVNAVPGVRMEERSPGSYRLSIRGSLLRSPWGVRNVKVYLDEFPLTDAGGNTYLNLVDPLAAGRLEILKGPHGSLFGAGPGGVLLINTLGRQPLGRNFLHAGLGGGSYGSLHEQTAFRHRWPRSQLDLSQAFLRSDGYRDHSGLRRHYVQGTHRWNYRPSSQLKVLGFYADMNYETPGGLTNEQYGADPRQARPAAGPNPGAAEQEAGIRSRTFFGGLSHQFQPAPWLRHTAMLFASHTGLENPFITNYEVRDENNYGFRTYLEAGPPPGKDRGVLDWKWHLGLEWQRSRHEIMNYDNVGQATKGDLQAADAIASTQYFYFTRFSANLWGRLQAEAAVSLNHYRYGFGELDPAGGTGGAVPDPEDSEGATGTGDGERRFSPQWMPRLSLSWLLAPRFSWRASVSRGFSPPTTAEIRPSNIVINTALDPETGWNHETGWRFVSRDGRFQADASVFYYRMKAAIVRRLDEGGNEYFVNAGGAGQLGVESALTMQLIAPRDHDVIRGLQIRNAYTYSHYRFLDYMQGENDYSGNELTGVPGHILVTDMLVRFPRSFSVSAQHNFTGRIPLNDGNSVYADSYHRLQLRVNWQLQLNRRSHPHRLSELDRVSELGRVPQGRGDGRSSAGPRLEFFAGGDNLLNEKYSLGNDINAFGGRYYNAAPARNYFAGVRLVL